MSADSQKSTYRVGVVSYRSYGDLAACLESIGNQKLSPDAVRVLDVDPDPAQSDRRSILAERFPWAEFQDFPNRGYAGGANHLVAWASGGENPPDFCLLLNPDVSLEPDFAALLAAAMASGPNVALGTGKLLRPDGRTLDSAGLEMPRHKHPRDRGSEQVDRGQLDQPADVFAASGAAMMLRLSAVSDLMLDGELFDEDFFLYREDTDLCWRAGRLGWRVRYEPGARARHVRGWRRAGRFEVPDSVRLHSFKNHYLQLIKNAPTRELMRDLPAILIWELLRLGFAVLRDRTVLRGYRQAIQLSSRAFHKRRLLQQKLRSPERRRR
ncbi:MAG: glycosyltransferase family 2 protein [Myxococcota bacterium]|nr:glycosyltransferase family 2 protein [Myxococcota bacterium]